MKKIAFHGGGPRSILLLGAHCDDIEIGCGGSVLKFCREQKDMNVHWVVFSSDDRREKEALRSANEFLIGARKKKIRINRFRNSFFPYQGTKIKEYFEKLKQEISPDLIFTHYRNDLHQDHRLICELTWNTFRDHMILEYEIPKYDGDIGTPNFFIGLDKILCLKKIEYIMNNFKSQKDKRWFTDDTFLSFLRIRGVESNLKDKFAEGFYCRKMVY